jgi:predicted XRE-type DNA-binding protein
MHPTTSNHQPTIARLPENLSTSDRLKFNLCSQFVAYLIDHQLSQKQLADLLQVDPSRINEIVKYRIHLYTIDRLLAWAEKLGIQSEMTFWED